MWCITGIRYHATGDEASQIFLLHFYKNCEKCTRTFWSTKKRLIENSQIQNLRKISARFLIQCKF